MEWIKAILGIKPKLGWFTLNYEYARSGVFTKYLVANDLHIGSKYQDNQFAHEELSKLLVDGFTILNGDIFDRSCCKKDLVTYLTSEMNSYKMRFGKYYLMGNHERNGIDITPLILNNSVSKKCIGFAHGDLISKSKRDKWREYRLKKPGSNWFGLLKTDIFDDMDHLKAMRPLPKDFLDSSVDYCNYYGLDVLVCGHFHVESERRYYYERKEIIILPAHKINEVWI